jgi:hypothetical protein
MRRTGFARKVYTPAPAAPIKPLERPVNNSGGTTGPAPKSPADRNQAVRDLARDEACTGLRYAGYCRCHPSTTVWAHPNEGGENKGMGYKGNDSAGALLGAECHDYVDGRDGSGATQDQKLAVMRLAQARTRDRLREIAGSRTEKLWKVRAARWALEQLEKTKHERAI